jgi:uncharacterized membrane protein
MARFVYALLVGLVGAGIIHIAILFLMPVVSDRDAFSALASVEPYETIEIRADGATAEIARDLDPFFSAVLCRIDLREGPVHVAAEGQVPFWSISIYDERGQNVFSLADRTVADRRLDIAVVTSVQMVELRNNLPDLVTRSLFVETTIGQGLVLVRAFEPDPAFSAQVERYLRGVDCTPF